MKKMSMHRCIFRKLTKIKLSTLIFNRIIDLPFVPQIGISYSYEEKWFSGEIVNITYEILDIEEGFGNFYLECKNEIYDLETDVTEDEVIKYMERMGWKYLKDPYF